MDHPISITVLNNAAGAPQESAGIMGLFCKAVAVGSTFALGTAYLLTQLSDATDLGINAAYDTANSVAVYQQVSEFYAQAGEGTLVWLFGVAKNTVYADYVATDPFKALIRFTAQSDPLNRVKMIGICYDVPTTTQSATDFPADVPATITALEATRLSLFAEGYQFSGIVDGYRMSASVTPANLASVATMAAPGVSLCITGTNGNGVSAVGLALGRFARISIGHGFGAVEDGSAATTHAYLTNGIVSGTKPTATLAGGLFTGINGDIVLSVLTTVNTVIGTATLTNTMTAAQIAAAFLTAITGNAPGYTGAVSGNNFVLTGPTATTALNGKYFIGTKPDTSTGQVAFTGGVNPASNGTNVASLTPSDISQLGQKQFMFLRTWFSKSGYYWNDGATCELATKPLSTQEYNRVANQLSADALAFFIEQMGKNLPLDIITGAVDQGYLNAKQQQFDETYIAPIAVNTGTGDITGGSITMLGPDFNVTKTITFQLKIVPTPILGGVTGTVEFVATL